MADLLVIVRSITDSFDVIYMTERVHGLHVLDRLYIVVLQYSGPLFI